MGSRGPARTPTKELRLAGSRLADDREKTEPVFDCSFAACPDWLDDESKSEWARIVPLMKAAGVLQSADWNAIERYCKARSRWKHLEKFVDEHGTSYETSSGQVRQYPEVAHLSTLMVQLTRLECEFGLTPASRSRVIVQPKATKSKKASYFETSA